MHVQYSVHCNRREICTEYNVYFIVLLILIITSAYLTHIGRISDLCLEIKRPSSDQAGKQDSNSTAENIRNVWDSLLTSFFHTLVFTDVQGMLRCGNHVSVMLSRNHLSIDSDFDMTNLTNLKLSLWHKDAIKKILFFKSIDHFLFPFVTLYNNII